MTKNLRSFSEDSTSLLVGSDSCNPRRTAGMPGSSHRIWNCRKRHIRTAGPPRRLHLPHPHLSGIGQKSPRPSSHKHPASSIRMPSWVVTGASRGLGVGPSFQETRQMAENPLLLLLQSSSSSARCPAMLETSSSASFAMG